METPLAGSFLRQSNTGRGLKEFNYKPFFKEEPHHITVDSRGLQCLRALQTKQTLNQHAPMLNDLYHFVNNMYSLLQ